MTNSTEISTVVLNLEERNRLAQQVVSDYTVGHASADVGIGIVGTIIPGAAIPAMIASIGVQAPLVYQPMAKKLGMIYSAPPDRVTTSLVIDAALFGFVGDIASEVGREFMVAVGGEIVQHAGMGLFASMLPLVGGVAGAALDACIAATLTWRMGALISMYYQNGEEWVGSKMNTYELAKMLVGPLSPEPKNRVDFNDIPRKNSVIQEKQVQSVLAFVDMMVSVAATVEQIRNTLISKKVPLFLIDLAMSRAFPHGNASQGSWSPQY